jgi:hypothetical protein
VLVPRLVNDVSAHDKLLTKHEAALAGIRGATAGAALAGSALGGLVVALVLKILG